MALRVYSEIGPLRDVMVHAPGAEVDTMPPSMMADLLFDDILHGPRARAEHRQLTAVLERFGVRVRDSQALLAEALAAAPEEGARLLEAVCDRERLGPHVAEELRGLEPDALASALVHGLIAPPEDRERDYLFRMPPIPNLMFSRDAQVVMADGVVLGAMSRAARQREPLLMGFCFRHHPELGPARVIADFSSRRRPAAWPHNTLPTLEGGDVLIFGEGVVVCGVSERTMEHAVDRLVATLRTEDAFHTLLVVPLPRTRSVMHLDTIFTRISLDQCLVYPPLVLPGSPETLRVLRVDLGSPDAWGVRCPSLLDGLRQSGVELEAVCCGGQDDYIQQAREQWTDGANSFAVVPGVVLLYERNTRTTEELVARGYHAVSVRELPFTPEGACVYDFVPGKRYAILVAGEELSRARGGPRCMTMPLYRDDV